VLLVRHAQHAASVEDGALTALGERQARALARSLELSAIDAVIASPLRRARDTAAVLRDTFVVQESLVEFDFGSAAPGTPEIVAQRLDLTLWRADDSFPGGESLRAFQVRVSQAMQQLVGDHLGKAVVAVTHSGFIDAALRWAYDVRSEDDWVTEAVLPNGSVTEIEHWPRGRHPERAPRFSLVRRLGDVSHLAPELITEI
jgi:probable phosphoglycerate mutase